MNKNKVITIGLVLALSLGAVACSNKTEKTTEKSKTPVEESTINDKDYANAYTSNYNSTIVGLNDYYMFQSPGDINKVYEGKEYPGNDKYVSDLKAAYVDSKDKIQSFIDGLKKDVKTEDSELKKMNDNLIAEGEKLIADIDVKIKNLDKIPKEEYTKSKEDFAKIVGEATVVKDKAENGFDQMIKDMNKMLGITSNNTGTNNNTETNTKK